MCKWGPRVAASVCQRVSVSKGLCVKGFVCKRVCVLLFSCPVDCLACLFSGHPCHVQALLASFTQSCLVCLACLVGMVNFTPKEI